MQFLKIHCGVFLFLISLFSQTVFSITHDEYFNKLNQKIDKIISYNDFNSLVKAEKCLLMGEVEFIAQSLLSSDKKIVSKAERKLKNKITKFLSRRYYYCNYTNWHIWFSMINRIQNKKLNRKNIKLKNDLTKWYEKYANDEWKNENIVINQNNEIDLILSELSKIPNQYQNHVFTTWKPWLCRTVGFSLERQKLTNLFLPNHLKLTFSYLEIIKSMNSISTDICMGIRMGAKFEQEKESWVENLKWLGRRDSNPRPID